MIEHAIESSLCAALKTDVRLSDIHFFTGLDDKEHELPAITIVGRSESLAGSAEVFRAEVEIRVETRAHDTPPQNHAILVGRIRKSLASKPALLGSLNAAGGIEILGYAIAGTSEDASDGRFLTTITLKAGCRSLPSN